MDRRRSGDRGGHVTFGIRGAIHFVGWTATDAVSNDLADARGSATAARRTRQRGADWFCDRLRIRGGVQSCLQTPVRQLAWYLAQAAGLINTFQDGICGPRLARPRT